VKLVREHINEKFTEDSDPVEDMKIGLRTRIKEWLDNENIQIEQNEDQHDKPKYVINDDGTIDVNGNIFLINNNIKKFPDYINFNIVDGFCDMAYSDLETLRGFPKKVYGYFRCSNNKLTSLKYCPKYVYKGSRNKSGNFYPGRNLVRFTSKDVKKYCKHVEGYINIE
jgi:hypothetical protein